MHESILNYRGYRYLWASLTLIGLCILAYFWHRPLWPANGGTWLGYTLGGISAALILWLLWLGVRKRRYLGSRSSVRGWTSAHVYLGLSLIVITTLHSGFQLGWNVHTLAYFLMWLVVLSGLWGLVTYTTHPPRITRNRSNLDRKTMHRAILELDEDALNWAQRINPIIHSRLAHGLDRDLLRHPQNYRLHQILRGHRWHSRLNDNDAPSVDNELANTLANATDSEQISAIRKLMDILSQRNRLSEQLARDLQLQAQMELWLYCHVPLSLALLAALLAHVFSVFFYW